MLADAKLVGFIPTTDFDRCRGFFVDVLGLRLVAEDPFAMTFDANGSSLRVSKVAEFTPQPFTIAGWWVDDAATTADALAGKGVTFERYQGMEQDARGLWSPPGGRVQVGWFKDTDGNTLSITGFVAAA